MPRALWGEPLPLPTTAAFGTQRMCGDTQVDSRYQGLDLPRFRGLFRVWDQGIAFDGILSSILVSFFCSAPSGAILPSRPAGYARRRVERQSRSAGTQAVRSGSVFPGRALTAVSTVACLSASGSSAIRAYRCS